MYSVDIADLLRTAIEGEGFTASANPLPPDFQTPYALVTPLGGITTEKVIDHLRASVDVYTDTWTNGYTYSQIALERARGLQGAYLVEVESLPYHNPDPLRPDLARMTFNLNILIRNIESEG